jgi:hypothetical protein
MQSVKKFSSLMKLASAFNQSFFHEQRTLIEECYEAMTSLRLILQGSLSDGAYSIPKRFENFKIWTY